MSKSKERGSDNRNDYKYSIEIQSADWALVACLHALCQCCLDDNHVRISLGGTEKLEWRRNNHKVKFHFKSPAEREEFVCQAARLFPKELWEKGEENDNDL